MLNKEKAPLQFELQVQNLLYKEWVKQSLSQERIHGYQDNISDMNGPDVMAYYWKTEMEELKKMGLAPGSLVASPPQKRQRH